MIKYKCNNKFNFIWFFNLNYFNPLEFIFLLEIIVLLFIFFISLFIILRPKSKYFDYKLEKERIRIVILEMRKILIILLVRRILTKFNN